MSNPCLIYPLFLVALRWTSWRRQTAKGKLRKRWRSLSRWCLVGSQSPWGTDTCGSAIGDNCLWAAVFICLSLLNLGEKPLLMEFNVNQMCSILNLKAHLEISLQDVDENLTHVSDVIFLRWFLYLPLGLKLSCFAWASIFTFSSVRKNEVAFPPRWPIMNRDACLYCHNLKPAVIQ